MKSLKRLFPYFKNHKYRFLLGIVFITISNYCSTYIPRVIGQIMDMFSKPAFGMSEVTWRLLFILLLSFGSGFFLFLTRKTIIVASRLIEYELRNDFLRAIERLPLRYFQKTPTGELMAHATNDIAAAREFIGPAVMYSANMITTFAFAITLMMQISPSITLFSLLPLPFLSFSIYKLGLKIHSNFRAVQEHFAKITSWAQENLSGVRVIRSYTREEFATEGFANLCGQYLKKTLTLAKFEGLMQPSMMLLVGTSNMIVLGIGGMQVIRGEISIGQLTQFFIYLNQLTWPMIAVGWVSNLIQRAAASMGRLGKIFDEYSEINDERASGLLSQKIAGNFEFRNVSFRYGEDLPEVLHNISFSVKAGETLGVVGETGSGKSSLVNLLPRLFDASKGEILVDGHSITSIPLSVLRQSIAVVPQESFLFSTTIAENIRFGNPNASLDDVVSASSIAQLHADIHDFPEGYNTMVGERGITLSGGQKQRTAIARAIIRKPSVLIFDDSLSAVDTETEEKILTGLRKVLGTCTSIIISHRISTVKNADRIIVLDDHRIAEFGTHDELLALGGIYSAMYNRQLLEEEIEAS